MHILDQLISRIDRLLLRQQELQRTNILLQEQLAKALAERDMVRSRLNSAGTRIDALLAQLAEQTHFSDSSVTVVHLPGQTQSPILRPPSTFDNTHES